MERTIFRILATTLLVSSGLAGCSSAPPAAKLDASIDAAESVLTGFRSDPAQAALGSSIGQAKAIMIVSPGDNRSVVLARNQDKWCGPAFYRVSSADAGGRGVGGAGVSGGKPDLEAVVLAMSDKALNWFMSPQVPGTAGLDIDASGSGRKGADLVPFVRQGARKSASDFGLLFITIDQAANQAYYGQPTTPADILKTQCKDMPSSESLRKAVAGLGR